MEPKNMINIQYLERYELEEECYRLGIPVFDSDTDALLRELILMHDNQDIYYDL